MTRSARIFSPVFALFLAACGADEGASAGPLEGPDVEVSCQTSLPRTGAMTGPLVLGFMLHDSSELVVMDAQVDVEPDASALSITVDPTEQCGPAQAFDPIPLNDDGTFRVDEVRLRFPHGSARARTDAEEAEAVVSLQGGFCTSAAALQGTYTGEALPPYSKAVDGAWFISEVTDPDGIRPTCSEGASAAGD
ncbi:MAG: hypothetical protein R3B89_31560 [Polyangiaceae bacterium]